MQAWTMPSFGIDHLSLIERETPSLGPTEVLVGIRAVSLNYRDLMVVRGDYNPRMELPRVPCSDGAGVVLAIGDEVTAFAEGDRVCGSFFQKFITGRIDAEGAASALGGAIDGMLAQQVVLDTEGLVHMPEHLSFEEGATLPCAAVTAWNALHCTDVIEEGGSVYLQGTGGVSIFALQLAKAMGATVYCSSSNPDKLRRCLEMGATDGVDYKARENWDEWVKEKTDGLGVDLVVEVGGTGTLERSMKAVRLGGHIALIGVLTGKGTINPMPLIMKAITLRGIYVGHRNSFTELNRFLSRYEIHPVIDTTFPFADAPEAFKYMESGQHFGKVVITLSEG